MSNTDILFSPIRLNELEALIEHSVIRALDKYHKTNTKIVQIKATGDRLVVDHFSVRTLNAIQANKAAFGISENTPLGEITLRQIASIGAREWMKMRNVGRRTVNDVKLVLFQNGIDMDA